MVGGYECFFKVFVHDGGGCGCVEGDASGDHVVEGGAEGVDVGTVVDVDFAADLFGADVVGGAVGAACFHLCGLFVGGFAGEAHIGEFGDAVLCDHDIFWFDVAVYESSFVGVAEGVGDLDDDFDCFWFGVELSFGEVVVDGFSSDVLHDEVVVSSAGADVDGLYDVVMVEACGGFSFFVETFDVFGVFAESFWQDFYGDFAVEAELFGFEDGGHCSGAEFIEDLVAGDAMGGSGLFDGGGHTVQLGSGDVPLCDEGIGEGVRLSLLGEIFFDVEALFDLVFGTEVFLDDESAQEGIDICFFGIGHSASKTFVERYQVFLFFCGL